MVDILLVSLWMKWKSVPLTPKAALLVLIYILYWSDLPFDSLARNWPFIRDQIAGCFISFLSRTTLLLGPRTICPPSSSLIFIKLFSSVWIISPTFITLPFVNFVLRFSLEIEYTFPRRWTTWAQETLTRKIKIKINLIILKTLFND